MGRKLRVAIDCRIKDAQQGVGTAVLALAKALSDSSSEEQEYTFIVREDMQEWLAPYVYGPCKLKGIPDRTSTESKVVRAIKPLLGQFPPLRFVWRKLRGGTAHTLASDGYVESQQFDVVHFATQEAYTTTLPTIYQPHDLQHLHYPQFFSKSDVKQREMAFRMFCNRASFVCVHAKWTKQDLLQHYDIAEEKVVVIRWGSVFEAYRDTTEEEIGAVVGKYSLPKLFFFYPAVTWPHKNHELILESLHILKREYRIAPHVVFTGSYTERRLTLDKIAEDLGVTDQVHFLGFVTPTQLQAIYAAATAMVYPSRFEGFGLPILEAFHARLPVLCSSATTLPEVAQNGALYFDADSPKELAALMKAVLEAPELRQDLTRKGTLILSQYSFADTAAKFQALYEMTAARPKENR